MFLSGVTLNILFVSNVVLCLVPVVLAQHGEADYYKPVFQVARLRRSSTQTAPYGYRPGSATTTHSCNQVRAVPSDLRSSSLMKPSGLGYFYQKYTEAYGIPVLSSTYVPDDALKRACYTLRFLLAGHSAVRQSFYRLSGRVAVIGQNEGTTNIPEHSNLSEWWNERARGLGATPYAPVCSGGEENVLCYSTDRYRAQDIFLHESAHGVHLLGAAFGIPGWDQRLRNLYNEAKSRGLWANTYSMSTAEEYFAEGTQSYFNVNSYSAVPDGVRGPINTRAKLRTYDPQLYNMIREVFPCDNTYLKRCESNRAQEMAQQLQMDCDINGGGGSSGGSGGSGGSGSSGGGGGTACQDNNTNCQYWANTGECSRNAAYMNINCKQSCNLCPATGSCSDNNQYCDYWAQTGECTKRADYMDIYCRKSCNKC